jgi:hypothetical protein
VIQILVKEGASFFDPKTWVATVVGFQTCARSTVSDADAATACARAFYGDDLERVEATPVRGTFRAFEKGSE